MRSIWMVVLVLLVVCAAPAAAEEPTKFGPITWAPYQEYLEKIGPMGRGAFAVVPTVWAAVTRSAKKSRARTHTR